MAANKDMKLFWASGSIPSWKAMLTLEEKGLLKGIDNKLCAMGKKENKAPEVIQINPRGQMPTFKDGDTTVNESGAICMYIEEKYSNDENRLLPNDVNQRALVYQRMFESNNIQSLVIANIFFYKMQTKPEDWSAEYLKEKNEGASVEVARWNVHLEGKDYLVGDTFTMADVFFFPYLAFMIRLGLKLETNTNLQRYYDFICNRPTVQATWPPHWKEGDGPAILSDVKA